MTHLSIVHSKVRGGAIAKVLIVTAIVVVTLAVIFGPTIARNATASVGKVVALLNHKEVFPESAWSKREAAGLTFDAPFAIGPVPDELSPDARKLLVRADVFQGDKSLLFFRVKVTRLEYLPGTLLSLDKAAESRIQGIAAALEDTDPKFSVQPAKIDGLEARQSLYHHESSDSPIYVEATVMQQGTVIWYVQVTYASASAKKDAQRILQSIHLKPA
jgi:hypothetical protein